MTVVTAWLQFLYVFVVMEVATRRILHVNVTTHPTAELTLQQFRLVSIKGAEIEIVGLGVDGKADTFQKAAISDEVSFVPSPGKRAFYLKLDVRGFFICLDRRVLYQRVVDQVRDPAVRWLVGVFLFHDPTHNCSFRGGARGDFERLPPHKTLFKARPGCGLPIGNLTSQFFANVYLDALDQFVKHELKARFYLRYCDDVVLLSEDQGRLSEWERSIERFLSERLGLQLNERRRLGPVSGGIDFLGYVVRADYLLVRRLWWGRCEIGCVGRKTA